MDNLVNEETLAYKVAQASKEHQVMTELQDDEDGPVQQDVDDHQVT